MILVAAVSTGGDLMRHFGLRTGLALAVAAWFGLAACDPRDILNAIPPEGVSSVNCSCLFDHPRGAFNLSPTCDYLGCMCAGWADAACAEPLDEGLCANHIADEIDECGIFELQIDRPDLTTIPIQLLGVMCEQFYSASSGESCGFSYYGQSF